MTESKRILFVTNALGPGGAERQLLYLLSGLDRARFEPHVLTLYDNPDLYHYEADLDALAIPHYTLAHGAGLRGRGLALFCYARLMWRLRPAIVQGYMHYANLIARITRPVCLPHRLITSARSIYKGNELRSEQLTHRLDDHLVVNSPHCLQQVQTGTSRPLDKVSFIPNAVPVDEFATNSNPALRQKHFPEATFVIGLIGRIHPVKQHQTLLKALSLLPADHRKKLAVFFLGAVSEPSTQTAIDELINTYQLQSVVHQFNVTHDVVPYYHAADIIVLPSCFEGFPNIVLESFATGTPVVISEGANAAGLVEHGVTGWVFPTGDAHALARCLQAARATSPVDLREMGRHAQEVVQQYSIAAMTERYTRLYDRLTGTPSRE